MTTPPSAARTSGCPGPVRGRPPSLPPPRASASDRAPTSPPSSSPAAGSTPARKHNVFGDTGVMLREVACPGARAQQIGMENANLFRARAKAGRRRAAGANPDLGQRPRRAMLAPRPGAPSGGLGGLGGAVELLIEALRPELDHPPALAVAAGAVLKGRRRLRAQGARLGAWARGGPCWVSRTSRAGRSSW